MTRGAEPDHIPAAGSIHRTSLEDADVLPPLAEELSLAWAVLDAKRQFARWSPGAERLTGWCASEIVGHPISRVDAGATLANELNSAWDRSRQIDTNFSCATKCHNPLELNIRAAPLRDPSGTLAGYGLLLEDVSETRILERALLEVAEREQRRTAQELHDRLCQQLLGAAFAAKSLAHQLNRDRSTPPEALHDVASLLDEAVTELREVMAGLTPAELHSTGLMSALQSLANRATSRIPCIFRCDAPVLIANAESALQAYRIAQDAVYDAASQTGVKSIAIRLWEDENSIALQITAHGTCPADFTTGSGRVVAKIMKSRAQSVGGTLKLERLPGGQTRIICSFPRRA